MWLTLKLFVDGQKEKWMDEMRTDGFIDWLLPVTWCLLRSSSSSWLNCLMWLLRLCLSRMALLISPSSFCNSSWSFCISPLCTSTSLLLLAASRLASFSSSSDCLRSATCTCSISKDQEEEWVSDGVFMCEHVVFVALYRSSVLLDCAIFFFFLSFWNALHTWHQKEPKMCIVWQPIIWFCFPA